MKLIVEEFEKDNDDNFHIDFIHALANVRAANYKLDEMDWITVKILHRVWVECVQWSRAAEPTRKV